MTDKLQKRTERLVVDPTRTTDDLILLIANKIRCKPSQFTLKFRRDGYSLRIIEGWPLEKYEFCDGSQIEVQERLEEENLNIRQKNKFLESGQMWKLNKNLQQISKNDKAVNVINEEEEIDDDKKSEASDNKNSINQPSKNSLDLANKNSFDQINKNSFESSGDDDNNHKIYVIDFKKQLDTKLEELLRETKDGHYENIVKLLEELKIEGMSEQLKTEYQTQLINENGTLGWNPLHFAVYNDKNVNILKYFVSKGGDVNKQSGDGWTPLEIAIHRNNNEIAKFILSLNDVLVNDISTKGTALHYACMKSNIQIIQLLLEKGADPYLQDDQGENCLKYCSNQECLDLISQWIQKQKSKLIYDSPEKKIKEALLLNENENINQNNLNESRETKETIDEDPQNIQIQKKNNGGIGQPKRPPIVRGYAFKHGDWIWTLRTRYFVLNPDEGTFIRYKKKENYPLKPLEVIPLTLIERVSLHENSWYMNQDKFYFEFIFHNQKHAIGFNNMQTAKKWVTFLKESIRYATYCEEKKIKSNQGEQADVIELMDNVDLDEQNCKKIIENLFNVTKQSSDRSTKQSNENQVKSKLPEVLKIDKQKLAANNYKDQLSPQLPQLLQKSISNEIKEKTVQSEVEKKQSASQSQPLQNINPTNSEKQSQVNIQSKEQKQPSQEQTQVDANNPDLGDLDNNLVNYKSFNIVKVLGQGAFGQVYLAEKLDDGKVYAIKALKKRNLILKKQLKYAVTEANVLKSFNHPFVLTLHFAFQTPSYLYLVMDYCSGGDLSQLLSDYRTFSEEWARFYIMELVLAIEHIHQKNVVYRDLKPENILLADDGHIKLADFGLAKDNIRDGDNTKSFCGSPAYLSPEMLNHTGAGKSSDLYGIGTVLYEMLTGDPPYYHDDIPTMYKNIKEGNLKFPNNISTKAKEIILRLLDRNPQTRLGAKGFQEIKNDPFFEGIDWQLVENKQYPAPVTDFNQENEDEQIFKFKAQPKKNFVDQDYTESNAKVNRVINFTFIREDNGQEYP